MYMSENFRAEAWTEFEVHKYYIARKKWDWIKIEVKFIASAVCPIFYDSGNCIRISIWLLTSTLFPQNGVSFGFWRNQIFIFRTKTSKIRCIFLTDRLMRHSHSKWPACTFWTEESVQTAKSEICILADAGFFFRLLVSRWREIYSFWGIWGP